jgi:hypothetical protein
MATAAERQRLSRERRKLGKVPVQVEVSRLEIDFLARRGYGALPNDRASVSQAVSAFLADSVLEATP